MWRSPANKISPELVESFEYEEYNRKGNGTSSPSSIPSKKTTPIVVSSVQRSRLPDNSKNCAAAKMFDKKSTPARRSNQTMADRR